MSRHFFFGYDLYTSGLLWVFFTQSWSHHTHICMEDSYYTKCQKQRSLTTQLFCNFLRLICFESFFVLVGLNWVKLPYLECLKLSYPFGGDLIACIKVFLLVRKVDLFTNSWLLFMQEKKFLKLLKKFLFYFNS